ncbi:hypothetical protein [Methylobacterium flocculans]|uniref:hypothetical protein n=1 Tax=Methylobacterium flocculans TaxID=2984843 RepID=UPI0021F27654|nr:hypothetical protein [Methylobacterium sp. FF17]
MTIAKRQLAASLRVCSHVADRETIAGFLADEATQPSVNPFRQTSAGAQLTTWTGQSFEFHASRTEALGLGCLLRVLSALPGDTALVQELFGSGPYKAYIYHHGDGCRIAGAVLHGRTRMALPDIKRLPARRRARQTSLVQALQLDLFAFAGRG